MDYQRADRVGDLLLEIIADLLAREIRDPRLKAVTLTGVRVSKDLRQARIFFSLLGKTSDRAEALAGLKSASGFIRAKLSKEINLRFVPAIEFAYDETEEAAQRIDALLDEVKK